MKWIYKDLRVARAVPEIRKKVLQSYACKMGALVLAIATFVILLPLGILILVASKLEGGAIRALELAQSPERHLRARSRALRDEIHAYIPPAEIRARLEHANARKHTPAQPGDDT